MEGAVEGRREAASDRADERPCQFTTDASSHPGQRKSAFAPIGGGSDMRAIHRPPRPHEVAEGLVTLSQIRLRMHL